MEESVKIADLHPELIASVDHDLDVHGLKKKHARELDRHFLQARTDHLEGLEIELQEPAACSVVLEEGRPRMPALAVFVFLLLRGWIGGPKSMQFGLLLKESVTLRRFLDSLGIEKVPGASTVLDNINAVSEATQQRILQVQLAVAREDGLDDMSQCRGDSTAVEANSQHPTDSGLMKAFALRATSLFDGLARLNLRGASELAKSKDAKAACEVAEELAKFCRDIGMLSGKRNVATARKDLYLKMYTRARRLERRFTPVWKRARDLVDKASERMELFPSRKSQIDALLELAQKDLQDLLTIAAYSEKRIVEEKQTPASDKIYSISDEDAAIIRKGGWEDTFGYRPQLAFSGKGLVTALIVPVGNAADNGKLGDLLEAVETNTGVIPREMTFDDGYTNTAVRNYYLERGVEVFSFAGANGRQVIGRETWVSAIPATIPR